MIQPELLSKQDRFIIAEYVYSQQQGILIKNDAEAVIKVLKSHGIEEANTVEIEEFAVLYLIKKNISEECIENIMRDYFNMAWPAI